MRHAAVAGSHVYGAQMNVAPGLQRPAPSHVFTPTTASPSHCPGTQTVLTGQRRQAPTPSQVPSQLQVDGCVAGQKVGVLGLSPASLDTQMPGAPTPSHLKHSPVHALSQQTPSAQKPLAQSPADAHDAPIGSVGRILPRSKPPSARTPSAPPLPSAVSSDRDRQALATVPIAKAASTHARIVPQP